MKKEGTLTILLCLIAFLVHTQVIQVHQGYCKKKEMEILSGDSLPKGYAIIQMGTFEKEDRGAILYVIGNGS
ncbi:MAG: hypothetical protein CL840_21410 [Crocinitomicaceae bacterium]|nr:hypothetical protein [Crocinitomicaceae bacterium]|tara:strand:- start:6389 stop:6604 length:216 start_codon:yes stop_codon:yes gene_type:complete